MAIEKVQKVHFDGVEVHFKNTSEQEKLKAYLKIFSALSLKWCFLSKWNVEIYKDSTN